MRNGGCNSSHFYTRFFVQNNKNKEESGVEGEEGFCHVNSFMIYAIKHLGGKENAQEIFFL